MVLTDATPSPNSCQHEKESLENDTPIESSACGDVKEKTFNLQPVPPFASGEGLPYAPEGWPNPGDIWSWKVGRRANKSGYFHDRYLYLPKSLQKPPRKGEIFQSKPDVIRYLESNFPDMKIEAFFAMFSWKVPSTEVKAVQPLSNSSPVDSLETDKAAMKKIGIQEMLKRKAQHCNQPIRKSSRLINVRPRFPPVVQGADEIIDLSSLSEESEIESSMECLPPVVQGADEIIGLCTLNKEDELESSMDSKSASDSQLDQRPSRTGDGQPENSSVAVCNFIEYTEGSGMQTATEESLNEIITETFGDYLDTLEDILVLPHAKTSLSEPMVTGTNLEEMAECKKKLSSFLAMEFPSLISCHNLVEVAKLASQLRKDSSLSIDQLIKLKLVEEIPLVREVFLEARQSIQVADKFLSHIEAKKLEAISLKNNYNELKSKMALVDAEIDRTSLAIQEIEDQILQLKSKQIEMSRAIETMQERKVELISSEKTVVNSIQTNVAEIKLLNTEKPKWEVKKANCAERVAEIHERFTALRGLTF